MLGAVALLGVLLPLHQGIKMFGADGHGGIAACPVALDMVLAHARIDQFHRIERLLPKPLRLRLAQLLLDFGNAAGIVADDLAAAAAGSAIADAGGFDQGNMMAGFGQRQGGAQARQAAAVILSHNHPSGSTQPSRADEQLTSTLKSALALVDVRVLDHIITAGGASASMAEMGLI